MPEGPEVHTIADWLNQQVTGFTLLDLDYSATSRYNKRKSNSSTGESNLVEVGLDGLQDLRDRLPLTIVEIGAKGKKIIFMLEDEKLENRVFLISSLMMEGRWQWEDGKHCDLWLRVQGPNQEPRNLYFCDPRHFGTMEIIFGEENLLTRLKEIGPDLLSDEITNEEWLKKIRNGRIKNKKIGLFLTEQKYFSGIGNYLRAEILYDAKISPHRKLIDLSDEEALAIFDSSRRLIRESYEAQGATLATYRNPHGGKGGFRVLIYNKKTDPLGNPVIVEDIGDKRSTYWVPAVQK
jgi:DNA-formamidopyrimidine glycosylase